MYKHILIATDGSELAAKGVEHGLALAGPLGAKVTVLTVTEPLPTAIVEAAKREFVTDPLDEYEHQMDEYAERLKLVLANGDGGKAPHLGSPGEVVIFLKPAVHSDLYRDQH